MEPNKKSAASSKYSQFVAIGMAIPLIWGVLILVLGVHLLMKLGELLTMMLGDIGTFVKSDSGKNEFGQNLLPYTDEIASDFNGGSWINIIAVITTLNGVVTTAFAAIGIYGGLSLSRTLLWIALFLTVIAEFLSFAELNIFIFSHNLILEDLDHDLLKHLRTSYSVLITDGNTFALGMNSIMLWFQCCGIYGEGDFPNLTYTEKTPGGGSKNYWFQAPPSCCNRDLFKTSAAGVSSYVRVRDCAIKGRTIHPPINTHGCYDTVFDIIFLPAVGILIMMLIWNLILLVLTLLTIWDLAVSEEENLVSVVTPDAEKRELIAPPPPIIKKFIPFAKISSAAGADLSRIRSTEIW